jgi:hypothetical protein
LAGTVRAAELEHAVREAAEHRAVVGNEDHRAVEVGERTLKPEKNAWDDVEDAFRYWAERLRDRLRELRKTAP